MIVAPKVISSLEFPLKIQVCHKKNIPAACRNTYLLLENYQLSLRYKELIEFVGKFVKYKKLVGSKIAITFR